MAEVDEPPELIALTGIELREAALIAWGAVSAQWSEDELLELLAEFGEPTSLLERLLETALVVRTPDGGYRSRSAETMRLLSTLVQSFRSGRVTDGQPLVLDHRFMHRPRRRPKRDIPGEASLAPIRQQLGTSGVRAAEALVKPVMSRFQADSTRALLDALTGSGSSGVVVTAGTGSGKTLAFYLPLLSWLADQPRNARPEGVRALGLYPRNELLKDQLRSLVGLVTEMRTRSATPLSLAVWFGDTPDSAHAVRMGWVKSWVERAGGRLCPFLRCPSDGCGGDMIWLSADLEARRERLQCAQCGTVVDGDVLRLTRDRARREPADLMLSTTESVNRQLAAPGNLCAFGLQRPATLRAVLLDEVHTYAGTTGAQNALLLRRMTERVGPGLVWAGLSATLRNAGEFFARLVNLTSSQVTVVEPAVEDMEDSGAEYQVVLRHDPHSRAGTLSTTIQACMTMARCLDAAEEGDPFNPPPDSNGVVGTRLFAFTDKLDSTNRLFWDLLDAEGWRQPNRVRTGLRMQTLAHLRSEGQSRLGVGDRQTAPDRDPSGQWWWLPEHLGHGVDRDQQLLVERTSSQDRGVAENAQVVVATATLEVGFDDDRVGAVLQHKAPHDAAQFLQRKGRAGRRAITRPWTLVVLSDWGRDRLAWDGYDALFDPELPPRTLPIDNHYVLRIQAVYALLDWLARQLPYREKESTWTDMTGPAELLTPKPENAQKIRERQTALAELLERLLRPGPERQRLRRHLKVALALKRETADAVVDTLLWEAPRPLLLAVVPTMRRRLREEWRGEEALPGDDGLRTRTPLRDFVPGNLFEDLLVPDVEFSVPTRAGRSEVEHLPALRALSEFCPGNVSRHFGIWSENKRHWLPLPQPDDTGDRRVDLRETYGAEFVDVVTHHDLPVTVYAPRTATLEPVEDRVKDASSVRPEWRFHVSTYGEGASPRLSRTARRLLASLTAHLHLHGGGARVLRFADTARGTLWEPGPEPVRVRFGIAEQDGSWHPAALGVDLSCDALSGHVALPETPLPPTAEERMLRLRYLVEVDADLADDLSTFDRSTLADIVVLAEIKRRSEASPRDLLAALHDAAHLLGVAADPDGGPATPSEAAWRQRLDDRQLADTLTDLIEEVSRQERTAAWVTWWRRQYTLTVAGVTLTALAALCRGVDVDELLVDIDPGDDSTFWITEHSPGGTGQIEAFSEALWSTPESFARALEDALRPSSAETMDAELTTALRSGEPSVHDAFERLRTAWGTGHAAATAAVEEIDTAMAAAGLTLSNAARSALSTRLLGPGAHAGLIAQVVRWLDVRERAEQWSGLQVDSRTLGALVAEDASCDDVLQLPPGATGQRRARTVSNILWSWGGHVEGGVSYNPFAPRLSPAIATVRAHVDLAPALASLTTWDDSTRAALHEALRTHGEVLVRVAAADARILRAALLDLQVEPVEVDSLLCHPVVVGQTTHDTVVEARVLLREATWAE